jgi:hypothetical protein
MAGHKPADRCEGQQHRRILEGSRPRSNGDAESRAHRQGARGNHEQGDREPA